MCSWTFPRSITFLQYLSLVGFYFIKPEESTLGVLGGEKRGKHLEEPKKGKGTWQGQEKRRVVLMNRRLCLALRYFLVNWPNLQKDDRGCD